MKFLILFLTLVLQHVLHWKRRSTQSRSFQRWYNLFNQKNWFAKLGRRGRYWLVVILPAAIIGVSFVLLEDKSWGLPAIALEILLLLYVLSHADFEQHFKQYMQDIENGDVQGAYRCAEQYLSVPEIELSDEIARMHDQVCHTLLYRWFEFFFLMVFWFLVLGVPGILLAWFSLQYSQLVHCDEKAWRPLHWLEWIPARLLGLTFALAGHYDRAMPVWRETLWKWQVPADDALYRVALASIVAEDHEGKPCAQITSIEDDSRRACDQITALQGLHRRSAIIWLVVIALITIVGGALY